MLVLWWTVFILNFAFSAYWMRASSAAGVPWDAIGYGAFSLVVLARLYGPARNYDATGRR